MNANERKCLISQESDLIIPDRGILRHQPGSVSVFRRYLRSFASICGSKQLFGPLETLAEYWLIQLPDQEGLFRSGMGRLASICDFPLNSVPEAIECGNEF